MKNILLAFASAFVSLPGLAQTANYYVPVLVDTVSPTTNNAHYMGYKPASINGKLFFCADSGTIDIKMSLYVTDGTTVGTKLLKDGNDWWGVQLWQTDSLNNKLLFTTLTWPYDQMLWESDGTTSGTQPVLDIGPGFDDVNFITTIGNKTFFFANDGVHGTAPWVTDGTIPGTKMLKDIDPNHNLGALCLAACAVNSLYYFFTIDNLTGELEIWVSDGTTNGTMKIQDFTGVSYQKLMVMNGEIYFVLEHAGAIELWATAGAIGGARKIGTLANDKCTGYKATLNDRLYFTQYAGNDVILWMTDGVQLTLLKRGPKPFYPAMNDVIVFNGYVYFNYNDGNVGSEIWRTDGLTTGMYKDVWPGINSGGGSSFTIAGGLLYFFSDQNSGAKLFCTDGTGPQIIPVVPVGTTPGWAGSGCVEMGGFMTAMNDTIYYKGRYDNKGWGLYKVRQVVVNSVDDAAVGNNAHLYPNPTNGSAVVELNAGEIKEIEVCDALGRRVYKQTGNKASHMEISLPAPLSNGIYILRISTQDGIVKQQLELNR